MQFVRKLVPLAAFFGLLAVTFAGVSPAQADVTALSPVSTGQTITINATYSNNPAGSGASIDASGGVNGTFTAATATGGAGVQTSGIGTKQVKISPDNSGNTADVITVTATFTCQGNGPVSFLLFQAGATLNNKSAQANCSNGTGTNNSGGVITVTPNQQTVGATATVQAACQAGSVLSASPAVGTFTTATVSGAAINAGGNSVTCTGPGQLSAAYNCTSQGATTFTLSGATGASAALTCGTVSQNGVATPTANLVLVNPNNSGRSSPVSISVAPEVVPCGGSASITVTASLIANASVVDGTTVNLYTSNGVIEPKVGVIKDGKFITTLKAPMLAGPVTINASVGGVTNYYDTKFDCGISAGGTTGSSSSPIVASTPVSQSLSSSPPPPPPPPSGFPTGSLAPGGQ
jgi:hypothetical protein